MHLKRPSEPRLEPIPKVMEKARKALEDQPVKAVNVLATLSHNRLVRDAVNQMCQTMLFGSELPRRQIEMVILRMGWNCQSVYEFGQHTLFGLDAGLTNEEIYFITRPIGQGAWSPADAVILQLADDLYSDDCLADATWTEASQHFSEADIIHFIATAGCYRLVSGFLNSTGVELDEGVPGWPESPGDQVK
ncbi:MAG: carboxymuconolactone decarboxylase family protein [Acidimicrobiales bacterium]